MDTIYIVKLYSRDLEGSHPDCHLASDLLRSTQIWGIWRAFLHTQDLAQCRGHLECIYGESQS